nr:hypothetical protein CFP56_63594 [Quercus suber]
MCCQCNLEAEDGYHALWDCPELSAIWEVDTLWLFCRSKKFSNFYELTHFMSENGRNPELFTVIAWMRWPWVAMDVVRRLVAVGMGRCGCVYGRVRGSWLGGGLVRSATL